VDANLSAALFDAPVGATLHVDGARADVYVADGSTKYPFKTVEAALAVANAAATATQPYLVLLAPGVYDNVAACTIGSYVRVVGSGWSQTILKCADLTAHFLTMQPSAGLRDVGIYGPTAAFTAGLYLGTTDPKTVSITEVQFHRGHYGILAQPVGYASLILRNCTYGYKAGLTMDTLVRLEGGVTAVLTSVTATGPDEALQMGVSAVGAAVVCTLTSLYHTCFGVATTGVEVDGGATLRLLSSVFAGGHTAIRLGADGASRLRADGDLIHRSLGVPSNYTYDIDIQSAAASVVFSSGFVSRDKIRNLAGATDIFGQFVNHETAHEGGCVLGEFYIGDHADTPFPMLQYTKDVGATGLVAGGAVTRGGGLVLDVAAGTGYVNDGAHPIRVTWVPAAVTLGANKQREYVYVTAAGLVTHADLKPDYNTNIVLARALTGAATVDLLTQDDVGVTHSIARQADYLEHTVGPLVESGCATLLGGGGGLKLLVAAGVFWVGLSERAVAGADDITFTAWYRSGGGWVAVPGQVAVDVTQWDDGSGALAALTGGKYTNATLYIAVNADGDEYHVVYGQAEFNNQGDAEAGALPVPPNVLKEYCCRSAALVVLQGAAVIASFVDVRPQVGQFATAGSGVAGDHDLLLNLNNDTHLQYLTAARGLAAHAGYAGAHVTNGDAHDHSGGDGAQVDHATLANRGTTTHANLDAHVGSTSNPHGVTAAQAAAIPVAQKAAALGVASLDAAGAVVQAPAAHKASHVSGTDQIDDATALAHGLLTAAGFTKLAGIAAGATVNVFGDGYQTATAVGRTTYNTNTSFQSKVTLTTPALPAGTYQVQWTAVIDCNQTNRDVEAQLYNTTDAAIVGVVQIFRPANTTQRQVVSGFAEVTFAGGAKAFDLQYRTTNTGAIVGIADARIAIHRVA
jgi:hypothetical protein